MASFPSALENMYGGQSTEGLQSVQTLPKPWTLLRLVSPPRPAHPAEGLLEMVEGEIIPRLLRAHPVGSAANINVDDSIATLDFPLDANAVWDFARMVLSRNSDALDALSAYAEKLRARGSGSERLYADLLAPAALIIADLWDEDEVSFAEVTLGLDRLRHMVRDLESDTLYNGESDGSAPSCLFSPRAGEQQTFGFYIVQERFRWSGWRTSTQTAASDAGMVEDVRNQWFDMVCLSVSRTTDIHEIAETIKKVRRASCNQGVLIMVNGRPFIERSDLAAMVGVDAVAASGRDALHVAEKAIRRLAAA